MTGAHPFPRRTRSGEAIPQSLPIDDVTAENTSPSEAPGPDAERQAFGKHKHLLRPLPCCGKTPQDTSRAGVLETFLPDISRVLTMIKTGEWQIMHFA
ncbi:hypothetical protein [Chromobacterium sp. IIBBL 290-4]|uniref:hypothetical protein n=1 Tax=Chromobacterium sp. IIBBL 290-4 TaxID=2953890 RepID=UPI0020B81ABE|nr:hypothetical protein [Chromobacterium sp. IIBBL 290-4]UTH76587.1 hypothetical protein NKT35_11015 [Chromobacterium sp. IIBBL 290-4]